MTANCSVAELAVLKASLSVRQSPVPTLDFREAEWAARLARPTDQQKVSPSGSQKATLSARQLVARSSAWQSALLSAKTWAGRSANC